MEIKRITFFRKWHGKQLEDWGGYRSNEYKSFERAFHKILKSIADDINAELVWFTPMHYDESAMFCRDGKYVYLRHSNNLFNRSTPVLHHILIRTAEHSKDYKGGPNNYSDWADLANNIDRLLGGNGDIEDTELYPMKMRFPSTSFDY